MIINRDIALNGCQPIGMFGRKSDSGYAPYLTREK